MRTVHVPIRRDEIRDLADHYHSKYEKISIDDVAERENIILVRVPDDNIEARGYATVFPIGKQRKRFPSLARPGCYIESEHEWENVMQQCIVINSSPRFRNDKHSEDFVFWHEFYHLCYSPTRNTAKFFHNYSTTGALDAQEERRANEFADLMTEKKYK